MRKKGSIQDIRCARYARITKMSLDRDIPGLNLDIKVHNKQYLCSAAKTSKNNQENRFTKIMLSLFKLVMKFWAGEEAKCQKKRDAQNVEKK